MKKIEISLIVLSSVLALALIVSVVYIIQSRSDLGILNSKIEALQKKSQNTSVDNTTPQTTNNGTTNNTNSTTSTTTSGILETLKNTGYASRLVVTAYALKNGRANLPITAGGTQAEYYAMLDTEHYAICKKYDNGKPMDLAVIVYKNAGGNRAVPYLNNVSAVNDTYLGADEKALTNIDTVTSITCSGENITVYGTKWQSGDNVATSQSFTVNPNGMILVETK